MSAAVGVVQAFAAVDSPSPAFGELSARLWFSFTDGAGQAADTCACSLVDFSGGLPPVRAVLPQFAAVGVPHNEAPIPTMGRADGKSWQYNRPCFVALGFQVSEYKVERQIDEPTNVLNNNQTGPALVYKAAHFGPSVARISNSPLRSRDRKRLAGWTSENDIWMDSVCSQCIGCQLLVTFEYGLVRVSLGELRPALWIGFAVRSHLDPAPERG